MSAQSSPVKMATTVFLRNTVKIKANVGILLVRRNESMNKIMDAEQITLFRNMLLPLLQKYNVALTVHSNTGMPEQGSLCRHE